MESPVKIVSACADTLVLNCYPCTGDFEQIERRTMSDALRNELEHLKKQAQEQEEPIPTRFVFNPDGLSSGKGEENAYNLKMQAKGGDGFNWILKNEEITLAVNRSSKMLLWAQVRCSSGYLQTVRNLGKVISDVHEFLIAIFGQRVLVQPSALDLAVDVVLFDVGSLHDVKRHFVTRAQLTGEIPGLPDDGMLDGPDAIKQRWGRLTGLPFGARKAALSALLYDKTHEIKYKSPEKAYMWDVWQREAEKQGFCLLSNATVWRVELRFRRPALNEMKEDGVFHGIDDAYDLERHLPGLWAYAVGHVGGGADGLPDGWLRYVLPSEDTNRSRWPVHPDWQVIQSAFQPEPMEPSPYEREQQEQAVLLQALDAYLQVHPHAPKRPAWDTSASAPQETLPDILLPEVALALSPERLPLSYYKRERKRIMNLRRLVAQIAGCTITTEAWRSPSHAETDADISDTFHFLYEAVGSYLLEKRRDFTALVHKKRVLYDRERLTIDADESIA